MFENRNFAGTAIRPSFVFPGMTPYVQAEARRLGIDPFYTGRVYGLWHVKRVQDGLGQLPHLRPTDQAELLRHVRQVRDGLALALAGCDAAISEVTTELGLVPEADKKRITKRPAGA